MGELEQLRDILRKRLSEYWICSRDCEKIEDEENKEYWEIKVEALGEVLKDIDKLRKREEDVNELE